MSPHFLFVLCASWPHVACHFLDVSSFALIERFLGIGLSWKGGAVFPETAPFPEWEDERVDKQTNRHMVWLTMPFLNILIGDTISDHLTPQGRNLQSQYTCCQYQALENICPIKTRRQMSGLLDAISWIISCRQPGRIRLAFFIGFLGYMLVNILVSWLKNDIFFSPEPILSLLPLSKHWYVFSPGLPASGWSWPAACALWGSVCFRD